MLDSCSLGWEVRRWAEAGGLPGGGDIRSFVVLGYIDAFSGMGMDGVQVEQRRMNGRMR